MRKSVRTHTKQSTLLPRDPYDALKLENDIVGLRLWGPANQPTLSLGRADLWDRRWFAERQPLVTMRQIKELAFSDRLAEVAPHANQTVYNLYHTYDFPGPKPGAQVILGCPFAGETHVSRRRDGVVELSASGSRGRLDAEIWVSLTQPLAAIVCRCVNIGAGDVWVRVWRHHDTLRPGQSISESLGSHATGDFEPMPAPRSFDREGIFGIIQDFPPEMTFPDGFQAVVAATVLGPKTQVRCADAVRDLGTPLWAPQEGRIDHITIKRYTPINEASGAAVTATLDAVGNGFTVLAAITTTHDGADVVAEADKTLRRSARIGTDGLLDERRRELKRARRRRRATVRVGRDFRLAAPAIALPHLRRPDGYYSDVPLCTVLGTKLWFQDVGLWHNDFHLNELRAEPMLTLGQTDELLPYCELIRNMLPMAEENARDVYGLPGAMYPLAHFPLKTRGVCHVNLTWEQDMGLNGLVSKPLWLRFRHCGDRDYLRAVAWPVLQSCARFCRAYLSEEQDGRLHIVPTVSPEHWGLTADFARNHDALSALTLTRYLLKAAAQASNILGMPPVEANDWLDAAARLAPYPTFATDEGHVWVDVAGAPPIEYNTPAPLSNVFWGDDVGLDSPPEILETARRTMRQIRIWQPHSFYMDACIRNRLGVWKDGAKLHPENFLLSYQTIRLFPCVPPAGEIVMKNFAAEGGFLVSAARTADGMLEDVRIVSRLGGVCRVANPWSRRGMEVEDGSGASVAVAAPEQGYVEFRTEARQGYRLHARCPKK